MYIERLHISIHTTIWSKCPPRTCSGHQCNTPLWQWLPLCLHCRAKTVRIFYVLRWSLWSASSGASTPRYILVLPLTCPQCPKYASSLNQTPSRKSGSTSILFLNYRFSMSAGVSLCLIWILHGYSWRSLFKILCNNARKRLSSWVFFGLLPTKSLSTYTLSGHLAVNLLPDFGFSAFLLRLFTDPVVWNLCTKW